MIKLKVKKLIEQATLPTYAKQGDACFDLVATSRKWDKNYLEYGTGLAMEIPEGHVGLIYPRSSITERGLMLKNSVGVIDSGYRGEVKFRFTRINMDSESSKDLNHYYEIGERIGQMMILPIPTIYLELVDELSNTERGDGGYGSTGK